MTADAFRRMALSLPEASEGAHMGHPDFRVRGKIFATLGVPDKKWGMVKLTPKQQREWIEADRNSFVPAAGAWGRGGATHVRLRSAKSAAVRAAMICAWLNVAPKSLAADVDL
jgi:hypothetical protein